ncbi:MAG: hypothetical protein ACKO0V_22400, partial [bacterium]
KPNGRQTAPERVRLQISPLAEKAKRFKVAAAQLGFSETELFEELIDRVFPSLHVQNLSKSPIFGGMATGQGSGSDLADESTPAASSVRIPNLTNRIADIARRSTAPVDQSIDDLASEPA